MTDRLANSSVSNLGVCPDCKSPFNGEFMHDPEHCKRQVMEWLSKIASKLDEEDASKVLLAGHTINRLARERNRLRAALERVQTVPYSHPVLSGHCVTCIAREALETNE